MKAILLALFLAALSSAQVIPGRYVVELSGNPAALGPRSGIAARRASVLRRQDTPRRAINSLGGSVLDSLTVTANALLVTIPDSRVPDVAALPGVRKIHRVRRARLLLDHALSLHQVPAAWALLPQAAASAGAGVKIAIIDTGIDAAHPAFKDSSLPSLPGFPKLRADADLRFTNSKIIVARNYTPLLLSRGEPDADDRNGHGTAGAMAAAGAQVASPYGSLSGVAPAAYLGNYKVADAYGSSSDVIAKAIDDAVADGMDVISLSLGNYVTSYADVSPDEIVASAIRNAAQAGVLVAVAAGNAGPDPGTIYDYASSPDAITVGSMRNDRVFGDGITIDGVAPYRAYAGDGPDPNRIITGPLADVSSLDSSGLACSPLPASALTGKIALILRGECDFQDKLNNAAAAGAIAAIVYNTNTNSPFSEGSVSVGTANLPAMFTNGAEGADLKNRASTSPDVRLDFTGVTPFGAPIYLSSFSSRGPSILNGLKPDLVAVGEELITATQRNYSAGDWYDPSGFVNAAGTSFSAPLAAGAVAVLKSARPGLTSADYRSLLTHSTFPINTQSGAPATSQQAGAGFFNLQAALNRNLTIEPATLNFNVNAQPLAITFSSQDSATRAYSLTALPASNSPSPVLSTSNLEIAPGQRMQLTASLDSTGLAPGQYSGTISIQNSANLTIATIPYWFAVPGSEPAGIAVLYSDYYERPATAVEAAVAFRIVDAAGLPYRGALKPTVTISDGATLSRVYPLGDIPSTYGIDFRAGASAIRVDISVGGISTRVTIPVF